ncbi:cbs domain multi-pass transmembrane [Nannochloropsis gaditana]|uniref:Cbs domain multi-pass transmembrane n=1 Tax=Nannochloropsis gaditana TaxID=72520 RepID=W7TF84_9STRA|nr:cbs domain multi-pass transmembrane [Nannochloropsis gaditana]
MVLIFGEILPSALFSGPNQLKIAARMASFVWFLMLVLSPISYPLSWLLDRFFGSHNPRKRYNRAELSALIEIHQEVKRRNISIVSSGPGRSNSNGTHASAHAYMTASSATSARAGLLSLSHPTQDLGVGSQGAGGKKGGSARPLCPPYLPSSPLPTLLDRLRAGVCVPLLTSRPSRIVLGVRAPRVHGHYWPMCGLLPSQTTSLYPSLLPLFPSLFRRESAPTGPCREGRAPLARRGGHRGGGLEDRLQDCAGLPGAHGEGLLPFDAGRS